MEKQKPKLVQGSAQENKAPAPEINKVTDAKSAQTSPTTTAVKKESQGVTQREAVYVEVMRLIREEKIVVAENQAIKPLLNEAHLKRICAALVAGFQAKKIALKDTEANKKKLADSKVMELYCLGLLNNWLRRDNRLNGTPAKKS